MQHKEERSEVEYIFAQFEEPERSFDYHTMHIQTEPVRKVIPGYVADTRLLAHDDIDEKWKGVQLAQLIDDVFSDMFRDEPLTEIELAAQRWQFNILHESDLDAQTVELALRRLQGVIETVQAARDQPVRWWAGKEGRMDDPRREQPGRWYEARDRMNRKVLVRKISALGVEVKDAAGTRSIAKVDAQMLYTIEKVA